MYKKIENLFGRGWLEGDLSEIRFVCFQEGFFGEEGYRVNEVRYDIDDVKGRRVEIILCEYLYLQSDQIIIEKRLGDNEQIIILKNGLVAFEKSVSFYKISKNQTQNKKLSYVNSNEDIIIEGPGLVIFSPYPRVKINIARVIISVVIPLLIVIIEVIISYLI